MLELDKNCTILIRGDGSPPPSAADIQKQLQTPNDEVKAKALQRVILCLIDGGDVGLGKMLMTVIRYVVPSTNHQVKKLLQIYFEIVDKCNPDGSLKEEMILVCNALRNDLMHPNEYVRGSTLKLLCKMRYAKILEPLVEAIMKNLSHRHSYVRRSAVMCVYSIVKSFGVEMLPHAAEEVMQLLLVEGDLSTKRNALLMLLHCDHEKAIEYALSVQDVVTGLGDIFQLVILELLRKVCRQAPAQKGNLLRIVINLVDSCSPAVAYEGAATLVSLSTSPVAVKAAINAYVTLLVSQADNNVRLIVLDRLIEVMGLHKSLMEGFAMDIMRGLSCPSIEVRKKTLSIGMRLVGTRTINDIVGILKKEVVRTMQEEQAGGGGGSEYRKLLIRAVHAACSQFPSVAHSVMLLLMDFLGETDSSVTSEVAMLIRELSTFVGLRPLIIQRVVESVSELQQQRVIRVCVWLVGEFCEDIQLAEAFINSLFTELKPLPIQANEVDNGSSVEDQQNNIKSSSMPTDQRIDHPKVVGTRTVVLEDGTYGTEDVYEKPAEVNEDPTETGGEASKPSTSQIRSLIRGGDFLLSSVIAVAITRLALRKYSPSGLSDVFTDQPSDSLSPIKTDAPTGTSLSIEVQPQTGGKQVTERLSAASINKTVYIVACLQSHARYHPSAGPSSDAHTRINQCTCALLQLLTTLSNSPQPPPSSTQLLVTSPQSGKVSGLSEAEAKLSAMQAQLFPEGLTALKRVLEIEAANNEVMGYVGHRSQDAQSEAPVSQEVDDLLPFRQLRERRGPTCNEGEGDEERDLRLALGLAQPGVAKDPKGSLFQQRLEKVQPMTGLADPVYVEAFVQVHQFDLVVELLIINRTQQTLQNVSVELSTHGDLKLVDRPAPCTLSADQSVTVYASVKVQSTETGIIFGHVTFDKRSATDKECLVLNELHVDLLDYIQKSWVGELQFRTMWSEFEWENKININTPMTDVMDFLHHIMKTTNMTLVSREARPVSDASQVMRMGSWC
eukprot:GHVN01003175.1.p1 GENE.GHVN01003175.1~~GHVN01003175.1.p1  ORF type:complete len:1009 (-),score=218.84 GHVN01003175.1:523-3549(-)